MKIPDNGDRHEQERRESEGEEAFIRGSSVFQDVFSFKWLHTHTHICEAFSTERSQDDKLFF